jgi:hypothetical protein
MNAGPLSDLTMHGTPYLLKTFFKMLIACSDVSPFETLASVSLLLSSCITYLWLFDGSLDAKSIATKCQLCGGIMLAIIGLMRVVSSFAWQARHCSIRVSTMRSMFLNQHFARKSLLHLFMPMCPR